jgi:replicative DNA helicase
MNKASSTEHFEYPEYEPDGHGVEGIGYHKLIMPEVERSILGAILLQPSLLGRIPVESIEADFGLDSHRRIYRRVFDLYRSGRPLDQLALIEELSQHGELEMVGGAPYLVDLLMGCVAEPGHLEYHVSLLKKKSKLRRIFVAAQNLQIGATRFGADPTQLLIAFTEQIQELAQPLLGVSMGKK